jgi:hypothetical protein
MLFGAVASLPPRPAFDPQFRPLETWAKSFGLDCICQSHSGPEGFDVSFTEHSFVVTLADGREISAPLAWFPRLQKATPEQRRHWRLIGGGIGICWEAVDEDISVESLLAVE